MEGPQQSGLCGEKSCLGEAPGKAAEAAGNQTGEKTAKNQYKEARKNPQSKDYFSR